jgi:hypothetical protein
MRKRYIDIKVVNMDRKKNEKDRSIFVNTQDGKSLVIKNGERVTVLEEVYENLRCAKEMQYALVKLDPDKPAKLMGKEYARIDITELTDFYYKDEEPKKELTKEPKEKKRKAKKLVEALA